MKHTRPDGTIRLRRRVNQFVAIAAGALVLVAGYILVASHAAQPSSALEAEQANLTPPAQKVSDTAASGGSAIAFRIQSASTPTPSPVPTPSPAPSAPTQSAFVYVCGAQLCLAGKPFVIHGATTYGQLDDPSKEVALAKQAGVNTLEIVEYEIDYRNLNDTMSERTWRRIDAFVATAKQNGLHVIINFSSYGHSLAKAGTKPTTKDWQSFLSFVANRTNSQTGVQYKNEPTIANVKLYGEIAAPNYKEPQRGTTAETTAFFKRTMAQWRSLAPNILVSTGGFSYINDPNSGIDWRTIVNDSNNAMCDVEINSFEDRNTSVPNMSSYCKQLGKPWFLAAWSACYRAQKDYPADANSWPSDDAMAAHAQDMYNIARNENPTAPGPAMAAAGADFWNLGNVAAHEGTCDIGPQFPKTFGVVQQRAPR